MAQKIRNATAEALAKDLSNDLYVLGSKYQFKAAATGHKRLAAYIEDLLVMSRYAKQIGDGLLPDYEDTPDGLDDR